MDEIQKFFMNVAVCHTGSRIHKISSTLSKVIGDGGGGGVVLLDERGCPV